MDIAERTLQLKTDFDDVYDAGKKAEYDAFWDGFQNYGNRTQYKYAFFQWRHKKIVPKYKIMPKNPEDDPELKEVPVDHMFSSCNSLETIPSVDYVDFLDYTPKLTATSGSWFYTFANCAQIKSFPDLNMKAGGYNQTWRNCLNLESIENMRCCEDGEYITPFYGCTKLKNIKTDGIIGTSFPIPYSPLTVESMKSIISHLKNYNGDSTNDHKHTVTFKTSAFEALELEGFTEEDKLWLSEKGIEYYDVLTWVLVIDKLKWNLVLA